MLDLGAGLVKPGGALVYVTCSVLPEENGDQVAAFLGRARRLRGRARTPSVWRARFGTEPPRSADGREDTLQLTPAQHGTDGFFVALMRRAMHNDALRSAVTTGRRKIASCLLQCRNWQISSRDYRGQRGLCSLSGRSPADAGRCEPALPERGPLRTSVHHGTLAKAKRPKRPSPRSCLGPVADLEAHLPAEWWRKLFNALYVKTDGDVVENIENTRREVDFIVAAAAVQPHSQILDLCCGQGRHCLELARRGFKNVTGVDRSRYLVRLAKKRAQAERLQVVFKEGDARNPRLPENSFDCVAIMGNSFGYFSNKQDDEKVLIAVGKILRPSGQLVLDITDGAYMADHFERRSWEWIDEHHFVCRERSLSGDRERLISREVIVHDELGVIADQFYAERLYTRESIGKLLEKTGFRNVRHHGNAEALSDRDQDLGMMARRILLSADAPQLPARKPSGKVQQIDVTVLMGDPRLPDAVKRGGTFNPEDHRDHPPPARTRCRSCRPTSSATSTTTPRSSAICRSCAPISCSTCATKASTTTPSRSCTSRRCSRRWSCPTRAPGRRRSPPATTRGSCAPSP